jgi:hypothetical protein
MHTLFRRPFRFTTIFPALWSSIISNSPIYPKKYWLALLSRQTWSKNYKPAAISHVVLLTLSVFIEQYSWSRMGRDNAEQYCWKLWTMWAAQYWSIQSCLHQHCKKLTNSYDIPSNIPCFIITVKNFMITFDAGRISTCRLPRFSALQMDTRASASTLILIVSAAKEEIQ